MKKLKSLLFAAIIITGAACISCSTSKAEVEPLPEPSNLDYGLSRTENLDFIFNTASLGKTTIVIKRSEWPFFLVAASTYVEMVSNPPTVGFVKAVMT